MTTRLLCSTVMLAVIGVNAAARSEPTVLTGAWRVTEIRPDGPDPSTITSPQPGLLLFTGNHYSMLYINGDKPRPPVPRDATAAEVWAFVTPFVANSGTYEIKGGTLTMRPIVAKDPGVMAAGAVLSYTVRLDGNTLTLTRQTKESTPNSPPANPTILKLARVE